MNSMANYENNRSNHSISDRMIAGLEEITEGELEAAREAILSALRATHDSPGAIESYYSTAAISGMARDTEQYAQAVRAVTREQVAEAARSVKLHTTYVLRGAGE
mgnify:CR=1 FL=1